ncbi:hypothetical protein JQ594_15575 [Bradyrhizobium manausense]|uniref:DUF6441 family protein n=1 Tax=Bradyrhizobium manausense TaxID=989370 RepID=UPI001BAD76F7|nr:DUF6441 family protein [Bradyrhizobium manausense]MBR0687351.1 hypothetical protein [Bradyrhizobium manausense]
MSFNLRYDPPAPDYGKVMDGEARKVARAATAAVTEAAALAKAEGRAQLAGFSARFASAMYAKVFPGHGDSLHPAALVGLKIKYASVFEDGATIAGKPYVWIPIEQNLPVASRGRRWSPRTFINTIGPLRSARHSGRPILLGQVRVGRSGGVLALPSNRSTRRVTSFAAARKQWLPVFVGVPSVTDPQRYNITRVIERAAAEIGELYARNFEELSRD